MKIERTKNAARNMVFGILLKIYQILVPFAMRTIMLYYLGEKYTGLNSLFTSILQVLNLAELGVGSAMVYSMYKPITEDDSKTICALMKLYRTYYRFIGGAIAAVGLALTPFVPKLIKGEVPPDMNVYVLYLLNLGATVLSYWLFAYKNSLLSAHQRSDVSSKVTMITNTVQYALQILALIFLKNYYVYLIIALLIQVVTNISTAIIVNKMYPDYKPLGKLPEESIKKINGRIRDLFTSKLGSVIVNSVDSIVISAFLGLTMLAIYQNYFFILSSIIGIVGMVFKACTAGIGNSIITETGEKNFKDLNKLTFIISWIAGFCCCCFLCIYQPFMKIWTGEKLMLNFSAVICFCVYFFVYEINQLLNMYKDAAGIWHEDRFRPLVTALANLIMNLIFVQFIGIYGIILSTVLSMIFVGMPWLLHNLFTVLFDKKQLMPYLKHIFRYVFVVLISCVITYGIVRIIPLEGIPEIAVRLIICCIVPNLLYLLVYRKTEEFAQAVELADKMTKGKLKLKKIFNK